MLNSSESQGGNKVSQLIDATPERFDSTSIQDGLRSPPFTMAAWVNSTDLTINQIVLNITASGNLNYWRVTLMGAVTDDPVHVRFNDETGVQRAVTTTSYSSGVWHHVCAVIASTTSAAIYIDGGSKGTDTNPIDPSGITQVTLAGRSNADYLVGKIGHAAFWDIALDDEEVASLSAGVSPLRMRRDNLITYWPLNGQDTEVDVIGGISLTEIGAPTTDEEPPIPYSIVAP